VCDSQNTLSLLQLVDVVADRVVRSRERVWDRAIGDKGHILDGRDGGCLAGLSPAKTHGA